ncbi:MAG TPA: FxLYD domain-containing protein [Bryobacteraceae bacterium]|nr:FxLYD domain-containing protein [Bryobacteraceae bacterium]
MVDNKTAAAKSGFPVPVVVVSLVLLLGMAGFVLLERAARKGPPPPPPLTGEAKAYVHNLQLFDVAMQAHESYLKQSVVEITGKIGNNGSQTLKHIEINCVFYDAYGQVVLRERVPIVSDRMGGLSPGEIKSFRLAFDNIPESWNQAMPQLVIASILFG